MKTVTAVTWGSLPNAKKDFERTCMELHFDVYLSATQQQCKDKFHGIKALSKPPFLQFT